MNTLQKMLTITVIAGAIGSGCAIKSYYEFLKQQNVEWNELIAANPSIELVSRITYQERISTYLQELATHQNPRLPFHTSPRTQEGKNRIIEQLISMSDSLEVVLANMKRSIAPSDLEDATRRYRTFDQQQNEKEMKIFPYAFLFPALVAVGLTGLGIIYEHNHPNELY